jgi:serine/threonine protein kinase
MINLANYFDHVLSQMQFNVKRKDSGDTHLHKTSKQKLQDTVWNPNKYIIRLLDDDNLLSKDDMRNLYHDKKLISRGSFGEAFHILCSQSGKKFAIKTFIDRSPGEFYGVIIEVVIHVAMNLLHTMNICKHIPYVYSVFKTKGNQVKYNMVMEYIRGPDLYSVFNGDYIMSHEFMARSSDDVSSDLINFVRSYLFQLFYTLHCTQQWYKFQHGDISQGNIMFDELQPGTSLYYTIRGKTFTIPFTHSHGLFLRLIDLGFSQAQDIIDVIFLMTLNDEFSEIKDPNPFVMYNRLDSIYNGYRYDRDFERIFNILMRSKILKKIKELSLNNHYKDLLNFIASTMTGYTFDRGMFIMLKDNPVLNWSGSILDILRHEFFKPLHSTHSTPKGFIYKDRPENIKSYGLTDVTDCGSFI